MSSLPTGKVGKPPRPTTSFNIKEVYEGPNTSNSNDASLSMSINDFDDAFESSMATIDNPASMLPIGVSPPRKHGGVAASASGGNVSPGKMMNANSSMATLTTVGTSTAGSFMASPPVSGRFVTALQNSESTFGGGMNYESNASLPSVDLLGRSLQLEVVMPPSAGASATTSITNDDSQDVMLRRSGSAGSDGSSNSQNYNRATAASAQHLPSHRAASMKRLSNWKTLELGDNGQPALQMRDRAMIDIRLHNSESRIQDMRDLQDHLGKESMKPSSSWEVPSSLNNNNEKTVQEKKSPSRNKEAAAATGKQLRKLGAFLSGGSRSKKTTSSSTSMSSLEESPIAAASKQRLTKRLIVAQQQQQGSPPVTVRRGAARPRSLPSSPLSNRAQQSSGYPSKSASQTELVLPFLHGHDANTPTRRRIHPDAIVEEIDNLAEEMCSFFALFQNPPKRRSQVSHAIQSRLASIDEANYRMEEYTREATEEDDRIDKRGQKDDEEEVEALRDELSSMRLRLQELEQDRDERESNLRCEVDATNGKLKQEREEQELFLHRQTLDLREELDELKRQNVQLLASKQDVTSQLQEALKQQESDTQSVKDDLREAQRNVIRHTISSKLNAVTMQEELEQQKSEVESAKMELKEAQRNIVRHSISSKKNLEDARREIMTLQSKIDRTPPTPSPSEVSRTPPTPAPSSSSALPSSGRAVQSVKFENESQDARYHNQELQEELEQLRMSVHELKQSRKQDAISHRKELARIAEERERKESELKRQVEAHQVKLELARIEGEKARARMTALEEALDATESSMISEFEESITVYDAANRNSYLGKAKKDSFSTAPTELARERSEYVKAAERAQQLYDEAQKSVSRLVAELGDVKEAKQTLEDSLSKEKALSASSRADLDMELAVYKGELENAKNELAEQKARAEMLDEQSQEMKYKIRYLEDEVSNSSFSALLSQYEGDNASFSALKSQYGDGASTSGGHSVSTETVLQATLEELDRKVMTTAKQLRQEREDFKRQSMEFNEALEEARRGKTSLELEIEEAHATIAELNEKRRQELEHYEAHIEEISIKSRSIASSLQSEIRHWKQEAWSSRDALEEAELRSRLMKQELDSLQTSKWELEVVRTKERKELQETIEELQLAHKRSKEEFEIELEETTIELEICRKALETATGRLKVIEEEGQERIVELENELTEARTTGRGRDVGGRELRSRLVQQLREANDRLELYGKELQESKLAERDTRLALKDAKARIEYLEEYVEDSRAAILDMKRTSRVETEELNTTISNLQQELESTKLGMEKDLAASKLFASNKNDELIEARRHVMKLEEAIGGQATKKPQPRESLEAGATSRKSDAVSSTQETRRLIQSVQAEIKLHKARKLAVRDKEGTVNLSVGANAGQARKGAVEKKPLMPDHSFAGSVDTDAMQSFAEENTVEREKSTPDRGASARSAKSGTGGSAALKLSPEKGRPVREGMKSSDHSGTIGSETLKSSPSGEESSVGRPRHEEHKEGSVYSGITGSYTLASSSDDISLKNHVPQSSKESGSVTSGISGCDSLHTSDDERMVRKFRR